MGKYNFSAQKFAELEERLSALEQASNELRKENAMLKSNAAPKMRTLKTDLPNYDKAAEIWGMIIADGELIPTQDNKSIIVNFASFYTNLERALFPYAYTAPNSTRTRIRGKVHSELTESEYSIFLDTLEACVDTIYYAKTKLDGGNKNGT